ncbi:SLBB domain-containing protein [Yoonia sp. R2-816]|uniref:SLBB domain-containing protein n=1 Tax=Yoonia sp. R2-816 TaxID=3342638 RepID=UPI003728F7ED
MFARHALGILCLSVMSGCGVIYVSPTVSDDQSAQLDVVVVPLTSTVVEEANQNNYVPKSLPREFFELAGVQGAQPLGGGSIPEPVFDAESRPVTLPVRLPPAASPGPYTIGVGDVILLRRAGLGGTAPTPTTPEQAGAASQTYAVQDNGAIALPDVGLINLSGLTIEQARERVFETLIRNQIDPSFSLEVVEFNSRRVTVGGEVKMPGVVPVTMSPLYLDEALAQAGGVTSRDDETVSVRIYRDGALYEIPLKDVYATGAVANRIQLVGGDSLFVDSAFDIDLAQAYFEQQIQISQFRQAERAHAIAILQSEIDLRRAALGEARAVFRERLELGTVKRDYIYITGEVAVQRRFPLPFEIQATLADALYSEGGILTETGNVGQVYLLRSTGASGGVTAYHLNARNMVNMILATRLEMRPNDIVFVSEQPVTKWNRVVQSLVPSLITAAVN